MCKSTRRINFVKLVLIWTTQSLHLVDLPPDLCVVELEEDLVINWSLELTVRLGSRLYALWNRTAGDCLLDSVLQATWGVFDSDNTLRQALSESISDGAMMYDFNIYYFVWHNMHFYPSFWKKGIYMFFLCWIFFPFGIEEIKQRILRKLLLCSINNFSIGIGSTQDGRSMNPCMQKVCNFP